MTPRTSNPEDRATIADLQREELALWAEAMQREAASVPFDWGGLVRLAVGVVIIAVFVAAFVALPS